MMPSSGSAAPSDETRGLLAVTHLRGAGSSIRATTHGAHLLEWTLPDTPPVLYTSPLSQFAPGKAIRGGVPVIFPWFGAKTGEPTAPPHGFVRTRTWLRDEPEVAADGTLVLGFTAHDDNETRTAWPHGFNARLLIRAGRTLRVALEIQNPGTAALRFEAALHTYFAVSDVRQIRIHGLEDTEYLDKPDGFRRKRQGREPIAFAGEVDRVYLGTAGTCTIEDPGWNRRIVVAKTGSHSTVVWNPWSEKSRAVADLGEGAWTGFVCVETANVAEDAVTLAPGGQHILEAEISVKRTG